MKYNYKLTAFLLSVKFLLPLCFRGISEAAAGIAKIIFVIFIMISIIVFPAFKKIYCSFA
ncbi:DUF1328 domain-containing protein [Subsaximicrobium wynnwilliamsii]|uniref:DUF1328 domain-containing protein n=1 Tax=Subsaximicrobium wynnwilliamsii TaxID=291179 RepID=A0A5C6ZIB5_9FLAO|nr:DUF1328 family protein [Subsaximicrobium wynnwilliamsii]TXD84280.1 DUF1328 domain-containing protein [Subsaximicrobium wynnwilliamsii]TXD89901.1 DUF1328 domain-containing protein [Subsaximicrobium wynnwilliamsii]TXE03992.1 DUF1328 domain-containing protein [Subsaximicrobium wynnwilliamsii]